MFEAFFMLLMQRKFVKSVENIQYSIFSFPNDMNYSECRPGR